MATGDDPDPNEPSAQWALVDDAPERPRRSDSRRNRDAVVDAVLELHREGNLQPSSNEVAERAGISPRSLFRYFADIDDLARAAISRQLERVRPLLTIGAAPDAPLPLRLRALAESRTAVFEAMGPSGTVVRLRAPFQPLIAAQLAQARRFFRQQIEHLLARELEAIARERSPERRDAIVAAADVLCSYESFQLLRVDHGMSVEGATAALEIALQQLFGVGGPGPSTE